MIPATQEKRPEVRGKRVVYLDFGGRGGVSGWIGDEGEMGWTGEREDIFLIIHPFYRIDRREGKHVPNHPSVDRKRERRHISILYSSTIKTHLIHSPHPPTLALPRIANATNASPAFHINNPLRLLQRSESFAMPTTTPAARR